MWRWSSGRNSRGPRFVNKKNRDLEDDEEKILDVQGCSWCVSLGHNLFGIWLETKTCYLMLLRLHDRHWQKKLINLLDEFDLRNKIVTYVKDESSNLNTIMGVFKSIVKCETLGLEGSF
jgi:hypothetical protein